MNGYILDFYFHEKKLAIEVDGAIHAFRKEYDTLRTNTLNAKGIKVLRFTNEQVFKDTKNVLLMIYLTLSSPFSSQEKGVGGMSSEL